MARMRDQSAEDMEDYADASFLFTDDGDGEEDLELPPEDTNIDNDAGVVQMSAMPADLAQATLPPLDGGGDGGGLQGLAKPQPIAQVPQGVAGDPKKTTEWRTKRQVRKQAYLWALSCALTHCDAIVQMLPLLENAEFREAVARHASLKGMRPQLPPMPTSWSEANAERKGSGLLGGGLSSPRKDSVVSTISSEGDAGSRGGSVSQEADGAEITRQALKLVEEVEEVEELSERDLKRATKRYHRECACKYTLVPSALGTLRLAERRRLLDMPLFWLKKLQDPEELVRLGLREQMKKMDLSKSELEGRREAAMRAFEALSEKREAMDTTEAMAKQEEEIAAQAAAMAARKSSQATMHGYPVPKPKAVEAVAVEADEGADGEDGEVPVVARTTRRASFADEKGMKLVVADPTESGDGEKPEIGGGGAFSHVKKKDRKPSNAASAGDIRAKLKGAGGDVAGGGDDEMPAPAPAPPKPPSPPPVTEEEKEWWEKRNNAAEVLTRFVRVAVSINNFEKQGHSGALRMDDDDGESKGKERRLSRRPSFQVAQAFNSHPTHARRASLNMGLMNAQYQLEQLEEEERMLEIQAHEEKIAAAKKLVDEESAITYERWCIDKTLVTSLRSQFFHLETVKDKTPTAKGENMRNVFLRDMRVFEADAQRLIEEGKAAKARHAKEIEEKKAQSRQHAQMQEEKKEREKAAAKRRLSRRMSAMGADKMQDAMAAAAAAQEESDGAEAVVEGGDGAEAVTAVTTEGAKDKKDGKDAEADEDKFIKPHRLNVVLGDVGSGKSTLLRALLVQIWNVQLPFPSATEEESAPAQNKKKKKKKKEGEEGGEKKEDEDAQVNYRTLLIPVIVPLTRLADFIAKEEKQAKRVAYKKSKLGRTASGYDVMANTRDGDDEGISSTKMMMGLDQRRKSRKQSFLDSVAAPGGIGGELFSKKQSLDMGAEGGLDILDRYWEATEGGRLSDRFRMLHQARREQRLLLLLDGLDECGDPSSQATLSAFIGGPLAREGQPMLVLATTPGGLAATKAGVSAIGENMAFQMLTLQSPSPDQYRDMLTTNLDRETRAWMGTREMVDSVAALPDVIRNPYSASLFVEWRFACGDVDFLNSYRGHRPEATFLKQDHESYKYDIWEAPVKELQQAQIQITGELEAPRRRSTAKGKAVEERRESAMWSDDETASGEGDDDKSVDSDMEISDIRSWRLNLVSLLHEHVRGGIHCGMLEHDPHMLVVVDDSQLQLPGRAHMGQHIGHPSYKGMWRDGAELPEYDAYSTKMRQKLVTAQLERLSPTKSRPSSPEKLSPPPVEELATPSPDSDEEDKDDNNSKKIVAKKVDYWPKEPLDPRRRIREHGGLDIVGSPSLCILPPAGIELLEEDKTDLLPTEAYTMVGTKASMARRKFAKGRDGPNAASSARARLMARRMFDVLVRATHLSHCRRTCVITTSSEFDGELHGPSATPMEKFGAAAAEGGSAIEARENGRLDGLRWKWEARQEMRPGSKAWLVEEDELPALQKSGSNIAPPSQSRWCSTVDEAFQTEANRMMTVELSAELKAMKEYHKPSAFAGDGGDDYDDPDDIPPEELQYPKKKGAQQEADEKCLAAVWERDMKLLPIGVENNGIRDAAIIAKKQAEVRALARALGALVRNSRLPGTKASQILHQPADPSAIAGAATASWGSTESAGLKANGLVWAHPTVQHFMAAQHIERECMLALELDECNNQDPRLHGSAFKGMIEAVFSLYEGDKTTQLRRYGVLKDEWWRPVIFMLARSGLDFERSVVTPLWQLLMEELNRRAAGALSELMWLAANACEQVVVRAFRLGKVEPSEKFYEPVEDGNVLPVHKACNSADPDTPLILSLLEADAEMPGMLTADSMAPIHFACTLGVPIPLVVATLIKRWPDSVLEGATDSGWIPLHFLCSLERPNLIIVRLLLHANALAATTKDVLTGKLALHLCCECASTVIPTEEEESGSDEDDDDDDDDDEHAAEDVKDTKDTKDTKDAKPKAKDTKDAKEEPKEEQPEAVVVEGELPEGHPESHHHKHHKKKRKKSTSGADEGYGEKEDGPRLDVGTLVVRELLASCPSTAAALDVSEKLPLHYACHRDCQSGGVVVELLKVLLSADLCTPCTRI
jgi:hypothetical protein